MPAVKKHPSEEYRLRCQACMERYMKLSGIDIQQMAKRMNVSEPTVYRWLKNPEKLPLEDIWRLAAILKCPVGELCGGELPEETVGRWITMAMKN